MNQEEKLFLTLERKEGILAAIVSKASRFSKCLIAKRLFHTSVAQCAPLSQS